mmetsp:Transcript_172564/g.547892  ORF Transcript_172564/g.547892 Transcript_172564/m.547892 type:complete len:243 (-) Transcript_172564:59-787(-)
MQPQWFDRRGVVHAPRALMPNSSAGAGDLGRKFTGSVFTVEDHELVMEHMVSEGGWISSSMAQPHVPYVGCSSDLFNLLDIVRESRATELATGEDVDHSVAPMVSECTFALSVTSTNVSDLSLEHAFGSLVAETEDQAQRRFSCSSDIAESDGWAEPSERNAPVCGADDNEEALVVWTTHKDSLAESLVDDDHGSPFRKVAQNFGCRNDFAVVGIFACCSPVCHGVAHETRGKPQIRHCVSL